MGFYNVLFFLEAGNAFNSKGSKYYVVIWFLWEVSYWGNYAFLCIFVLLYILLVVELSFIPSYNTVDDVISMENSCN